MKKLLLVSVLIASILALPILPAIGILRIESATANTRVPLDNDWLWKGNSLYTLAEKVGIGTASPRYELEVSGRVLVVDRLGTNGFAPDSGYPPGWYGGIHTWDVYAEGSVGVGRSTQLIAWIGGTWDGQGFLYLNNTNNGEWARLSRWTNRFEIAASDAITFKVGGYGDAGTEVLAVSLRGIKLNLSVVPQISSTKVLVVDGEGRIGWTDLSTVGISDNDWFWNTNPPYLYTTANDVRILNSDGKYIRFYFGSFNDIEFNGSALVIHPRWVGSYNPSGVLYISNDPNYVKVGIGTDQPQYRLDVAGDVRALGAIYADYLKLTEDGSYTGWVLDYFPSDYIAIVKEGVGEILKIDAGRWINITGWLKVEPFSGTLTKYPSGWGMGVWTWDVYAEGSLAVGTNGGIGVWITHDSNSGKIILYASGREMIKLVASEGSIYADYLRITESGTPTGWVVDYYPDSRRLSIVREGVGEIVTFLPSGFVGIGTTNPQYRLDVAGDIRAIAGKVYADYFWFTEAGNPTEFAWDYFPNAIARHGTTVNAIGVQVNGVGRMFIDDAGYVYAPRFYITEEGQETQPRWYLDYYPDGSLHIVYINSQGNIVDNIRFVPVRVGTVIDLDTGGGSIHTEGGIIDTGGGAVYTHGGEIYTFGGPIYAERYYFTEAGNKREWYFDYYPYGALGSDEEGVGLAYGNDVKMFIDYSGDAYFKGKVYAKGFETLSSIRFKTDVQPLKIDTSLIYELTPVSFRWKDSGEEDFGLIAEDVAKVLPQIVAFDENGVPIGIDYAKLVVLMLPELKKHEMSIRWLNETVKKLVEELRTSTEPSAYADNTVVLHSCVLLELTVWRLVALVSLAIAIASLVLAYRSRKH